MIATDDLASNLDVAAVVNVFKEANRLQEAPAYTVRVVSTAQVLVDRPGLHSVTRTLSEKIPATTDTFIVTGSDDFERGTMPCEYRHWLHRQCSASRRTVAIGVGTLRLAAAGLLDGRKAATHWELCERLKRCFPRVLVEPDVLYTNDHNLYTCAGALASIDLALRLVEDDLSKDVAAKVASRLLLHFRRTGGSSQVSVTLRAQATSSDPISRLLGWLPDNLTKELSVRAMASRVAMSPRNVARLFRQQVGVTPAKHIENLRLEAAQRELQNARQTVANVAELSGFANNETLRRIFLRRLGVTPAVFRKQIHTPPV